ncbi:MAG: alpha/beta hydrolase [Alphaproteobacteria bacterium]
MQKIIIVKNRKNIDMSVRITIPDNATKLVFVEHGFSGAKDEKHILIVEEKFNQAGCVVVNIDATNSLNKSGSSSDGISFSSHYNDLEDVINWAKGKYWYKEPFALVGHSLGACSVVYYAQNYPEKVDLLLPLSFPWLSGKSKANQDGDDFQKEWEEKRYIEKTSSRTDRVLVAPYSFMEDLFKYDFLLKAENIKARTILIIGDLENEIRLEDNQKFLNMLQCEKELHILSSVPHALAKTEEIAAKFSKVLDKILI